MYRFRFLILFALIISSCKKNKETKEESTIQNEITTLNYNELKPFLHKNDDKTYVINFWATWCLPCVKELPAFEKLNKEFKDKNVEVILVSLDFSKQIESNLIPFIKKKEIKSKVLHFEDKNEQFWIQDIADSWSGSIPATLIYTKNKRKFYEQSFHYETLKNELQTFLNQ
ncbi:redoxin domain-containing protein [Tenacibaculum sp. HL-MS23]|uniref:TlpA disulfide reductase family protein n=1 Tax=Tenacibaculum sp. HL-MS23 TaxID=3077734 RepID=UPI0028FC18FE|nr:redoxin domain-containing protein [Tenacibaculum sp. HL-MS23]WNW01786.1 redoxin domain-containing protein [Tenacibaculum sp. HL-MS23]